MGAGSNSYLIRDSQIDVLRNIDGVGNYSLYISIKLEGQVILKNVHFIRYKLLLFLQGIEDAGLSFTLTPPAHGNMKHMYTPSKALLAGRETKMNILCRYEPSALAHADIETGKVTLGGNILFVRDVTNWLLP